jgi:hypothetical protein
MKWGGDMSSRSFESMHNDWLDPDRHTLDDEGYADFSPAQEIIDLLAHDLGDDAKSESGIRKRIYKGTECGAHVSLTTPYEIAISSIVENGDQEIGPYSLKWPFTRDEFWAVVARVEEEADEAWVENEIHRDPDDDSDGIDEDDLELYNRQMEKDD